MAVASDPSAGLTEPVTLVATGAAYVADAFVKTSLKDRRIAVERRTVQGCRTILAT